LGKDWNIKAYLSAGKTNSINEEVKIAVATESGLVKIASLAYEPEYPIKPNKKLNILIAGVLGLFVGIFVVFFLEFWQQG
jgi:uncharacterized protein involved in exopolysaccharide biosynthesis